MTLTPMEEIAQAGVALNLSNETMIALMAIMNADRADFKKFNVSVLRDDSNPTVAYQAGLDPTTAITTHSRLLDTSFPDAGSDYYIIWAAQARLNSPGDGVPVANLLVTNHDNLLLSNVEYLAHSTTATGYDYIRGSVGGIFQAFKPAGETVTLHQKVYLSGTDTASDINIDNMDLLVLEMKSA